LSLFQAIISFDECLTELHKSSTLFFAAKFIYGEVPDRKGKFRTNFVVKFIFNFGANAGQDYITNLKPILFNCNQLFQSYLEKTEDSKSLLRRVFSATAQDLKKTCKTCRSFSNSTGECRI